MLMLSGSVHAHRKDKEISFPRIISNLYLLDLSDWMTFVPNYRIDDGHGMEEPKCCTKSYTDKLF